MNEFSLDPGDPMRPTIHDQAARELMRNAGQEPETPASSEERRVAHRPPLRSPALVIPLLPDLRPDVKRRSQGMAIDLNSWGIGLECEAALSPVPQPLVVGIDGGDGRTRFGAIEARHVERVHMDRVRLGGPFAGRAQELLRPNNLQPILRPDTLSLAVPFPEEVLQSWADIGVLKPVLADQAQVCPRCQGLPTFRPGCRSCGAARLKNDLLIHHFACAHVGRVEDFETPEGLRCPKCRALHLVVGADYEFLTGPYRCRACGWSDSEPETVGHCLRCHLRFPAHQAHLQDLVGYDVDRLDVLALPAAPRASADAAVGTAAG